MKETALAYLSGLIEADGSFCISRSHVNGRPVYDPLIRITTTHLPTVRWIVDKFGGSCSKKSWSNPAWKDYYAWKHSSDLHASRLLDSLLPYLWIKKEQALVLRDYYRMRGAYGKDLRQILYEKIGRLNQGEPVTTNMSGLSLVGKNRAAYFAGLFDGEGSCYIIKVKQSKWSRGGGFYYRASVCLSMARKDTIDALHKCYGGHARGREPHNGVLPMYEWSLKDNPTKERFLLDTIPYMITKREQAKSVLEFVRMNGRPDQEKRIQLWLRCCALNGNKRESDLTGDCERAPVVTQVA